MASGRTNGDDHDERSVRALVAAQRAETKTDGLVDDLAAIRDELIGMREQQRRFAVEQVDIGASLGNILMVQTRLSNEIVGLNETVRDMSKVFDRYSHVFSDFAKVMADVKELVLLKAKVEGGWKVIAWISASSLALAVLTGIAAVVAWLADYLPHIRG